ncbi:hypothetical protein HELRODRAFT_168657 [Helobdella robusta]|uniref:RUN domain-containing protein n=1 Tax=Helobdella robusta TaxID=6412 RepID=T1F0U3_HELRO|nr:hypothetical protein HELRODRAFT_168657 [Helobdella robusta]ESO08757.1 hypothetical protein HELRODRAFT_168657 [Helobdella robusta]
MAKIIYPDFMAVPNQIQVQRQNLLAICRLAVNSLTDRNDVFPVDENSPELQNFLTIIEHILSHRIKPNISWYGGTDERFYWDFIQVACKDVPNNCLSSVQCIAGGRAWLRMCLMEKRLSDYMMTALHSTNVLESFYEEGSIMLCDESSMLPDILLGLSAIDFKSRPIKANTENDASDDDNDDYYDDVGDDNDDVNCLKIRCSKLTKHLKMIIEQKRYLEDLLRVRDIQIAHLTDDKKRMNEMMESNRRDDDKERGQLENVIFELQSQIFHLREQNKGLTQNAQKLQLQFQQLQQKQRNSLPTMLMSRLLSRESQLESEYETNQNETETEADSILLLANDNNTVTTDLDSPQSTTTTTTLIEPKTPNFESTLFANVDVTKKKGAADGNNAGSDVENNFVKNQPSRVDTQYANIYLIIWPHTQPTNSNTKNSIEILGKAFLLYHA